MLKTLLKINLVIISMMLSACASVSWEDFWQDRENIEKSEELAKKSVADTEECKEIKDFIAKEEYYKKDLLKILNIMKQDPKAIESSEKLESIDYSYFVDNCYIEIPTEDIKEYCSKKYYKESNCIDFLTEKYPRPQSKKYELKNQISAYVDRLKEEEEERFIKQQEKEIKKQQELQKAKERKRQQEYAGYMNAIDILVKFWDNVVAFNKEYEGKIIKVHGIVQRIDTQRLLGNDEAYVMLFDKYSGVKCISSDTDQFINLKREQHIKVYGVYKPNPHTSSSIELTNCVVVTNKQQI